MPHFCFSMSHKIPMSLGNFQFNKLINIFKISSRSTFGFSDCRKYLEKHKMKLFSRNNYDFGVLVRLFFYASGSWFFLLFHTNYSLSSLGIC